MAFREFDHIYRFVDEFLKGYVVNVRHEYGSPVNLWVRTTGRTRDGKPTLIGYEWDTETHYMIDREHEILWEDIIRIEIL
jgi:hypothetical protein